LQLVKELQKQSGMGVIFITHDLGVVAEIADKAVVMYKGEMVEQGTVKNIFTEPKHPYTKALLACRPVNHKRGERLPVVADFMEAKSEAGSLKSEKTVPISDFRPQTSILLRAEHLSVWFPAKRS